MDRSSLYAAIDLHSNNGFLSILDDDDRVVFERRLPNRIDEFLSALGPHRERIVAIAVESTFNWYWLVDGLESAGFAVMLVNTAAVKQYEGLKHADDRHDARLLAHLMRLGILPVGYIMPKALRAVRDLLRKRMRLVQQRTANVLSVQNLMHRNRGRALSAKDVRELTVETATNGETDPHRAKALEATVHVIHALETEIEAVESCVRNAVRENRETEILESMWGVGKILSMTIQLETGPIERFATPGDYASYCRCVKSERLSNGKLKGRGNDKCGNRYLAWAWVEAANFAIRFYAPARAFYERKASKRNPTLARKAIAHKLARAAWHMLRKGVSFQPEKVFG